MDRAVGDRYDIWIVQAEFSLTQVVDRPSTGRVFFEEVIRENLDIGRPDHVQLIFERRITKQTPGRFRTRVITEGVTPSLHIDYKRSRIKQYHKEGRALQTETTINDPHDFDIGKRLSNLPAYGGSAFKPVDALGRPTDRQDCSAPPRRGPRGKRSDRGRWTTGQQKPLRRRGQAGNASSHCWCSVSCLGVFPTATCTTIGLPCWVNDLTTLARARDLSPVATAIPRLERADPGDHRYQVTGWARAKPCFDSHLPPNRTTRPRADPSERCAGDSKLEQGFDQIDQVIAEEREKKGPRMKLGSSSYEYWE